MISTSNDGRFTGKFFDHSICSMPANVMKGIDLALAVFDDEEIDASNFIPDKRSHFWNSDFMRKQLPVLGEDCTTLKVIDV